MKHIVVFSVFVLIITLSSLGNNFSVVQAFHVPSSSSSSSSSSNNNWIIRNRQQSSTSTSLSLSSSPLLSLRQRKRQQQQRVVQLFASSSKDDDSSGGAGMEDAFRELEALQSLDEPERPKEKPKEKDEAFAKAMGNLDLKDILSKVDEDNDDDSKTKTPSLESELEIFKDMASELELASEKEELIVADFKSDLLLADDEDIDIDIDNDGVPAFDTEKFMDKAIEEALKEAKERNSDVEQIIGDKDAFLDNKEIMSEITKIFDVANDELLEGLEEIRTEQKSLAREAAEQNAQTAMDKIKEDELRLEMAQRNMKKMLNRVNDETKNVQLAIDDLKREQKETEGGLDSQLVDLKSGGLIKQATLAGGLLFTFRGGAELIGFLGGDPSHAIPALIQGALAILCIAAFIFL